jgi:hypothetical protein
MTLPCVATKVDLFEHLAFEWGAFFALSTDRPGGMNQGAIPWTSIDRYASRYGVIGDEFERLSSLIRAMDNAFLSYKKE